MPGKTRVSALAKELGLQSKVLIEWLNENGEYVKTASSTIEAPAVRKAKEAFIGALVLDKIARLDRALSAMGHGRPRNSCHLAFSAKRGSAQSQESGKEGERLSS